MKKKLRVINKNKKRVKIRVLYDKKLRGFHLSDILLAYQNQVGDDPRLEEFLCRDWMVVPRKSLSLATDSPRDPYHL